MQMSCVSEDSSMNDVYSAGVKTSHFPLNYTIIKVHGYTIMVFRHFFILFHVQVKSMTTDDDRPLIAHCGHVVLS